MKGRFLIAHPSEIVAEGLSRILNRFFDNNILYLNREEQYKDLIYKEDIVLVLCSTSMPEIITKIANPGSSKNLIPFIGIIDGNPDQVNRLIFNDPIDLNIDAHDFYYKCKEKLKQTKFLKASQEGNLLSARELDVLKRVASGYSNKRIAEDLFISIHTVISHRKNITEKTGIKSVSGLTIYAILNKLIDPQRINYEELI